MLFSAVNIARFLKVDAEDSLNASTEKFINRFCKVEQLAQQQGIDLRKLLSNRWNSCGNRRKSVRKGAFARSFWENGQGSFKALPPQAGNGPIK